MHNAVLDVVGCQAMKNSPEIAEANRLKSLERINKQKQNNMKARKQGIKAIYTFNGE